MANVLKKDKQIAIISGLSRRIEYAVYCAHDWYSAGIQLCVLAFASAKVALASGRENARSDLPLSTV